MGDILACRLCLSTNVKLFNMYKYRLDTAYENLTGLMMTAADDMQQACSTCSTLLLKSTSFQQMCRNSQDLLKCAQAQQHMITTEYIQSLKITSPHTNLKIHHNNEPIELIHMENTLKEESYWDTWDNEEFIKEEGESSDEEPLSTIVVKKSNRNSRNGKSKKKKCNKNNGEIKLETEKDFNDTTVMADVVCDDNDDCKVELNDDDIDGNDKDEDDNDFKDGEVDIFILTKEQQIEEVQSRKTSLNYMNSFYKCDYCFKGFITEATFKNHMIRHDPSSGAHACEACGARWASARALRAHCASAHERRFLCRLCSYVSKSRHRAKEHSKWHSGHTFVCKYCGMTFAKSTSHLTHVRLRHPAGPRCALCGEAFLGAAGLSMHRRRAHAMDTLSKEGLCCTTCNVQFQNEEALRRHESEPCDDSIRPCLQCGEGFSSDDELKGHLKEHSKEEPIKCEECGRVFRHARSLSAHVQRAHAARAPPPKASVVCELCGKECMSNTTLRYHQRIHTGERPYQCKECPKKFSVFQRLQIHRRTHTGERPYKCSHCPKAFKHKAALNRHDRVHTGAKPYACSHCGKAFSQSNSMKLHIRTVHLKMPSPYRARRMPPE